MSVHSIFHLVSFGPQLEISWQPPPTIDHNGALTAYQINYSRVGGSTITMTTSVGSTSTTYTLTGLVAHVDYSIQLAAMNNDGIGPFSTSVVLWSGQMV